LGTDIVAPGFIAMYNQALGSESYTKCALATNGEFGAITTPISIFLKTERWRVWDLSHDSLYIGYDPEARSRNRWWESLREKVGSALARRLPEMFGDLVVFRPRDNLLCNEKELRRELINFAVVRFKLAHSYKFSWETKN
jgi:hypothetical protein